jgi:hypothetical protein
MKPICYTDCGIRCFNIQFQSHETMKKQNQFKNVNVHRSRRKNHLEDLGGYVLFK